MSHKITGWAPAARVRPSGENATEYTVELPWVWPCKWLAEGEWPGRVGHVPQEHRAVVAGGGQGVPVRGERHRDFTPGVAGQRVAEAGRAGSGR